MESFILMLHHHCNHISQQCIMFMVIYRALHSEWSILSLLLDCIDINRHVLQSTSSKYSDNKFWAGMFQTSLIDLSYYSHLLSISFMMNVADICRPPVVIVALWELDHLSFSYLVILQRLIDNINLFRCDCFLLFLDEWFASLPLRVLRPESRDEILF
jgi:hypothetical protein